MVVMPGLLFDVTFFAPEGALTKSHTLTGTDTYRIERRSGFSRESDLRFGTAFIAPEGAPTGDPEN